ncbi:box C/D snoRNA protein 1 isoform X2 [Halictus rubicundus]|uniref:box C/D snoRNA protein 1 isoform X2 n=1 Tax=Halictus rubicundus TaxID=77578 RepID=UPI004036B16B
MATSSEKIENCEVCGATKAKYTCPKCEVRTCCLQCVNIHKKELECDGVRDKTKFVPLKSFTDLDVLSDYRLLEEIGRSVEQLKRDPFKKCTRQNNLPVHLFKLRAAAFKRNVNLQFMPQHFSRHQNNTTYLNWKTNELFWRIEWIFAQADHTKWVTNRVLENTRLSNVIENILDPLKSLENTNDIDELNLRMCLNDRLQFYQAAGLPGIKFLLKAERVTKSDAKFHELDVTLSLQENFKNKTIIEFPIIYAVLKEHSDIYEIIDTGAFICCVVIFNIVVNLVNDESINILDDECMDSSTSKSSNRNIPRKRVKTCKQAMENTKTNSTVNYFFNSEFSESEEETGNDDRKIGTTNMKTFNIPNYDELVKMEQ